MKEVFMPKLGPSMEQGIVARWYKSKGEQVRRGEHIVDIETDKTVQEVEAEADGVVLDILVAEGAVCAVGKLLALIGAAGESVTTPVLQGLPSVPREESGQETGRNVAPILGHVGDASLERMLIKASPAARRVARENSIDLGSVRGTGPGGRIIAEDVRRISGTGAAASPSLSDEAIAALRDGVLTLREADDPRIGKERFPMSSTRRMIAERMARSKRDAPHFYVSMDVDMGRVQETRLAWKALGESAVPSHNDFIMWGVAQALKAYPALNSSLDGDELVIFADINVGMATAIEDGLIVPVIHHAERMSVRGIASHSKTLAERARAKKLTPADCDAGTFTVSNLGMFGVDNFVAIINPPQCAILAVGQVAPRVVTDGTSIAIRLMVTLTISVDHRISDGVLASQFLASVKATLEKFSSED